MKLTYETPEMTVIYLDAVDILTVSGDPDFDYGSDSNEGYTKPTGWGQ